MTQILQDLHGFDLRKSARSAGKVLDGVKGRGGEEEMGRLIEVDLDLRKSA